MKNENEFTITNKKKKTHLFEIFILKVLKQISPANNLTNNAKQQLNSFVCVFLKQLVTILFNLTSYAKKKTYSVKEVENAMQFMLTGDLLKNSLLEGEKAVVRYNSSKNDTTSSSSSKQVKAGILFPPSIIEKFLKTSSSSNIMVANNTPIYLATICEYIIAEILDVAVFFCRQDKRTRIIIRDIELGIQNDEELKKLVSTLNVNFIGGGVVPYIHNSLFTKKNTKKHTSKMIKVIKTQQKLSNHLVMAKSSFERMVRHIISNDSFNSSQATKIEKISKSVFLILQYYIEQYTIKLLNKANFLTIHANRIKLMPIDIDLINSFINHSPNPYIIQDTVLLDIENTSV
jgi:histone H3/H4